jgi:hypothetical protein
MARRVTRRRRSIIKGRLLSKFDSTLQKHYWENFTPLVTSLERSVGIVGGGTQFFKKHVGVPDLASKFQAWHLLSSAHVIMQIC